MKKLIPIILLGIIIMITFGSSFIWVGTDKVADYFSLDQTSGTIAVNNITQNANGSFFDSSGTLTLTEAGIIGTAMNITNTSNSYLNISYNLNQFEVGNWSVSLWVNRETELPATATLFQNTPSGTSTVRTNIDQVSGDIQFRVWNVANASFLLTYPAPELDKWQHYVFIQNGTSIGIYQNGTLVNSTSTSADFHSSSTHRDLTVGGKATGGRGIGGRVDEFGIWNRTLSGTEISELYNGGLALQFGTQNGISVNLNTPLDDAIDTTNVFNSTITPTNVTLTNATLFVWEDGSVFMTNFTTLTGTTEVESILSASNLTVGNFTWNVYSCSNNDTSSAVCDFALSNNTYTYGYKLNNHTFNNPVLELSSQTFTLNLTLPTGLSIETASLLYNNTVFSSTKTDTGADKIYDAIITTPSVSADVNISWAWNITLNDGGANKIFQVNNGVQQINNFAVDDCTVNTRVIANYTIKDEETQTKLGATIQNTTGEIQATFSPLDNPAISTIFSQNYTKINSFAFCTTQDALESSSFRLDVLTSYKAKDYVTEFHNIQNLTLSNGTATQNIELFDLKTVDAQEFLITFKDSNFLPVEDAIIDIQRKYINEGTSKSVEIPKTDGDGQALGSLVLSDVIYTFIVKKDGVTLGTFADRTAFCNNVATGDCTINLNIFATDVLPFNFDQDSGLTYTLTYNDTSRIVNSIFTVASGVKTVDLNVSKFDNFGNSSVCSDTLTTSSGSLSCTVADSFGNTTIVAELYVEGDLVAQALFSTYDDPSEVFGASRIIMVMILLVTLPLLALTSGVFTIVFLMVGVIVAMMLNLVDGGSIIGVGSTLLWLVITGGLIIWKITRKE